MNVFMLKESMHLLDHPYGILFFHTQLMQTEVDSYAESSAITPDPPSCQLELHFQRTEQPYERLSHQIKVNGIRGISTITITRDVDPGK